MMTIIQEKKKREKKKKKQTPPIYIDIPLQDSRNFIPEAPGPDTSGPSAARQVNPDSNNHIDLSSAVVSSTRNSSARHAQSTVCTEIPLINRPSWYLRVPKTPPSHRIYVRRRTYVMQIATSERGGNRDPTDHAALKSTYLTSFFTQ